MKRLQEQKEPTPPRRGQWGGGGHGLRGPATARLCPRPWQGQMHIVTHTPPLVVKPLWTAREIQSICL